MALWKGSKQKMIDIMGQLKILSHTELRDDACGGKVHVIPDVHGNRAMLRTALQKIENLPLAKNDKIIVMGNFIGEHGNTKDVVALLRTYEAFHKEQLVVLRGQTEHELLLTKKKFFQTKSGLRIINHYRHHPNASGPLMNEISMVNLFTDVAWIAQRPAFHISHNFIFVHSGIAPTVKLHKQDTQTCVYIQKPFHKYQGNFYRRDVVGENVPLKVVHSNTTEAFTSGKPRFLSNRIDVGTLVDPGAEIAVLTMGDYGKNFTEEPEVNRVWIEQKA
jgi:hypothetical protein